MKRLKLQKIVEIPKDNPIITFKKLNYNMVSPYQMFKYELNKENHVNKFNSDIHSFCTNNRIYSIPKSQLNKWNGIRVFECRIWGKCILEENDKIGSEFLKLYRELNPKEFLEFLEYIDSEWAYWYCKDVKDRKEVRDKITDSKWTYLYCKDVKDRKEIRDRITDSYWAYWYCRFVKDRKEVRDRITESRWAYRYCRFVKDRKEVRDRG